MGGKRVCSAAQHNQSQLRCDSVEKSSGAWAQRADSLALLRAARSAWPGRYARVLLASARCADLPPSARAGGQPRKGCPNLVKASAPVAGSDDAEGRRAAGRQCGDFTPQPLFATPGGVGRPAYQAATILYSTFSARRSRWEGSWLKGQGAAQIDGKRRVESLCQKSCIVRRGNRWLLSLD
jgi:hypothetical protein